MSQFPSEFRRIRLELAREPGHPEGSRRSGYELVVPLDGKEHLSADLWRKHKDLCRVHRFRENEDNAVGRLARRPGGSWYFDYDQENIDDDEAGYRLGSECFVIGEYVSIADDDGKMHTYRVVEVEPA